MIKLLFLIGLVVLGIWVERKYSPRIKDGHLEYNSAKGVRNKKKLW